MTTLQILITLLVISVALNAFAFWFVRNLLTKLLFVSNNLGEVNEVMQKFAEHLDAVHGISDSRVKKESYLLNLLMNHIVRLIFWR